MTPAFATDEWASLLSQLKAVELAPASVRGAGAGAGTCVGVVGGPTGRPAGVPAGLVQGEVLATRKSRTCLAWSSDGGKYVLKAYPDPGRAGREASVMAQLRAAGLAVPAHVAVGEHALLREYVEGTTLRECDDSHLAENCAWLARWLRHCHELGVSEPGVAGGAAVIDDAATWLVGDMNLRNYVVGKADFLLWGIDFGDTRRGDPYDDVGEGVMRILIRPPAFAALNWEAAVGFVDAYGGAGSAADGGSGPDTGPGPGPDAGRIALARRRVIPAVQKAFVQMAAWRRGDPEMLAAAETFPEAWARATGGL